MESEEAAKSRNLSGTAGNFARLKFETGFYFYKEENL